MYSDDRPVGTSSSSWLPLNWKVSWLAPALSLIPLGDVRSLWDVFALGYLVVVPASSKTDQKIRVAAIAASVLILSNFALSQEYNGLPVVQGIISGAGWAAGVASARFFFRTMDIDGWAGIRVAIGTLALGIMLGAILHQTGEQSDNVWKYGIGLFLSIVVAIAFSKTAKLLPVAGVFFLLALVSLSTASRYLAGAQVASVVIVLLMRAGQNFAGRGPSRYARPVLVIIVIIGVMSLPLLSQLSVVQPTIERFQLGAKYNDDLLLAGRVEPPAELAGILNSPLFGIGVDGPLNRNIIMMAVSLAQSLGYKVTSAMYFWWFQGGTIYTHSMIATAWLQGGIIPGLLALIAFFFTIASLLLVCASQRNVYIPIAFVFIQIVSAWNLLASPASYGIIDLTGLSIASSILLLRAYQQARPSESAARGLEPPPLIRARLLRESKGSID